LFNITRSLDSVTSVLLKGQGQDQGQGQNRNQEQAREWRAQARLLFQQNHTDLEGQSEGQDDPRERPDLGQGEGQGGAEGQALFPGDLLTASDVLQNIADGVLNAHSVDEDPAALARVRYYNKGGSGNLEHAAHVGHTLSLAGGKTLF
jgi:hypothetical protein